MKLEYGTWIIDWLTEEEPYCCFDIWLQEMRRQHPNLDLGDRDLVDLYDSSIEASVPLWMRRIFLSFNLLIEVLRDRFLFGSQSF